jgi:uncharacterized membrane protein
MIKKHWKVLTITSVATLLPVLVGLVLWHKLPPQLPIHWNAQGEIDGFGSKTLVVFGMPLFLMIMQWVLTLALLADPKRQNHSGKMLHLSLWLVPAVSILVGAVTYATALGHQVRIERIIPLFLGLLFVIIGNYMPKCKQNYTVGIKLPWTLHSEENWNKTHRLAGFLWVIGGLAIIVSGFFGSIAVMVIAALVMTLIPLVYSYILHRKGI